MFLDQFFTDLQGGFEHGLGLIEIGFDTREPEQKQRFGFLVLVFRFVGGLGFELVTETQTLLEDLLTFKGRLLYQRDDFCEAIESRGPFKSKLQGTGVLSNELFPGCIGVLERFPGFGRLIAGEVIIAQGNLGLGEAGSISGEPRVSSRKLLEDRARLERKWNGLGGLAEFRSDLGELEVRGTALGLDARLGARVLYELLVIRLGLLQEVLTQALQSMGFQSGVVADFVEEAVDSLASGLEVGLGLGSGDRFALVGSFEQDRCGGETQGRDQQCGRRRRGECAMAAEPAPWRLAQGSG